MKTIKLTLLLVLAAQAALFARKTNINQPDRKDYPVINGYSVALAENPWELVEELFVTQPQNTVAQAQQALVKTGLTYTGIAVAANLVAKNIIGMNGPLPQAITVPRIVIPANIINLGNAQLKASGTLRTEERKVMEQVMIQWNDIKAYFPESLRKVIDALYDIRETEAAQYAENVDKTIDIIKAEVAAHLPKSIFGKAKSFLGRNSWKAATLAITCYLAFIHGNNRNSGGGYASGSYSPLPSGRGNGLSIGPGRPISLW